MNIQVKEAVMPQVKIHVLGKSESPTKMNIRAGKFKMVIDEPESMGGSNEGPSPVQMLLTALAGCLNVTGHQVAKENNLDLERMTISIDGNMNPCTFMGCSFKERAGFQSIKVVVKPIFSNSVSDEMVKLWLEETEARCPVTDNIKEGTQILIDNN